MGDPGACPPDRWTSREAHLPGDPDRGHEELEALPDAIDQAIAATVPGGRIAVLSYHSGEDRIVKERFALAAGRCACPAELPCVCGAVQTVRIVRGIAKRPSDAEQERNPRASSARLRVVEKL
ncbi:MAG: 16S rRNA (cytosine(1402)-N(4))-methyltransferase [Actinomycetota bacterium]